MTTTLPPTPWKIRMPNESFQSVVVEDANGKPVATIPFHQMGEQAGMMVATMLAAAPELLDACQDAMGIDPGCNCPEPVCSGSCTHSNLVTAITKATTLNSLKSQE